MKNGAILLQTQEVKNEQTKTEAKKRTRETDPFYG